VVALAGGIVQAWDLGRLGLTFAGARDISWARLVSFDYERRAAEDPDYPGIAHDSPERRESARIVRAAGLDPLGPAPMEAVFDSREEALESTNLIVLALWGGEYARCLPLFDAEAEEAEATGRFARAARAWAMAAICRVALGRVGEARGNVERAEALANRLGTPIFLVLNAQDTLTLALDEGWDKVAAIAGALAGPTNPALAWGIGWVAAVAARAEAGRGAEKEALAHLDRALPWLERAPAWTLGFSRMACLAAEVLWILDRRDHAGVIEQALREKVVAPDFRYAMVDGRLALAQLCALTDRVEEAVGWFGEAREVLGGQGARPLLAICDHDEALMYARRGAAGDSDRARSLLAAARRRFIDLGMTGWVGRADELTVRLG